MGSKNSLQLQSTLTAAAHLLYILALSVAQRSHNAVCNAHKEQSNPNLNLYPPLTLILTLTLTLAMTLNLNQTLTRTYH